MHDDPARKTDPSGTVGHYTVVTNQGTTTGSIRFNSTARLIFGLVVISVGMLFLLDEFGILHAGEILRWWPAGLALFGLMKMTGTFVQKQVMAGAIFTLVGFWLLLGRLDLINLRLRDMWPFILIAVGGGMIYGALRPRPAKRPSADSEPQFSAFAFWSGVDRKVSATDFKGGEVVAIMGGHDLDLRPAKLAGESAEIDLLVIMGGVDIRIPEDWALSAESLVVMGAIEDRTRPPAGEVRGRLVLKGFVMMGGVEVKN